MPRTSFARMLMKFCQQRATTVLSPRDADLFHNWLLDLLAAHVPPLKHLARALEASAAQVDATALNLWRRGVKVPRASRSLAALELIERRYRLPPGYFRSKLPNGDRCTSAGTITGISRAER